MTVLTLSPPGAPPSSPKVVRGRCLPLFKLGKAQRAVLGAELKEGSVVLTDMSVRQIAAVVGVSTGYITAALKSSPLQREGVRRGLRPLIEPHAKAGPEQWLAKLINEIGIDGVRSMLAGKEKTAA